MNDQVSFGNARIILGDEVVTGSLRLSNGRIASIDHGTRVPPGAIDAQGDFLAPGLVELHTDNLERHLSPRPKVHWPHGAAILAHDREMAGTGVTTVFDAIRVGSIVTTMSKRYDRYARQMTDEIEGMRAAGALRISHHIHLRAETCSQTLIEELAEFSVADRIGIVSMMDHTPEQRQFSDMEKYKAYVCGKHGLDPAEFDPYVAFLRGLQAEFGTAHEAATVAAATRFGATLASHDDTTAAQVASSHAHGITIVEFPTTVEAAQACHASNIRTMMGAPNLVRGASHSGNVAAQELAQLDRLDMLSSDYVPASLLMGAVQLGALWGDMARGIATVTATPARAVDLHDRGRLEVGLRADVIQFSLQGGFPVLKGAWHAGLQVA